LGTTCSWHGPRSGAGARRGSEVPVVPGAGARGRWRRSAAASRAGRGSARARGRGRGARLRSMARAVGDAGKQERRGSALAVAPGVGWRAVGGWSRVGSRAGRGRGLLGDLVRCAAEEGEGRAWEREKRRRERRRNGGWETGSRVVGGAARVRVGAVAPSWLHGPIGPLGLGVVLFFSFFSFSNFLFSVTNIYIYIYSLRIIIYPKIIVYK
jgi:hypothetical protein